VAEVAPVVSAPGHATDATGAPWGYRAKVHFVFGADAAGRASLGHFRRGSRRVLPVGECPVHPEAGNETARLVRDALVRAGVEPWHAAAGRGAARHIVVRVAADTGERLATLVVGDGDDRRLRRVSREVAGGPAAPDGWHINENGGSGPGLFGPVTRHVSGRARLRETVAGVSFLLSPAAFFQTNVAAAGVLVEIVAGAVAAAEAREVLDLYAGAGLFALPLARRGCRVTAVEENPLAVADGEASRAFSQIAPRACRFVRSRVEDYVARLRSGGPAGRAGAVVLDPPREGCAPGLLAHVLEHLAPAVVAYVSCEPVALGRDLAALRDAGLLGAGGAPYGLAAAQPVDMFPHTPHVETVAVLRRRR
jgi:23S rRNA (uracil-5-)-methyltransferase RumA